MDTPPFRPFVRCTRLGDSLICTPWNYGDGSLDSAGWPVKDEGDPRVVRGAFKCVENTPNPDWTNYDATVQLVLGVAGRAGSNGYFLSNMTSHSDGPHFSATVWNLKRR